MRVLGQAWSVANAPAGTLPQGRRPHEPQRGDAEGAGAGGGGPAGEPGPEAARRRARRGVRLLGRAAARPGLRPAPAHDRGRARAAAGDRPRPRRAIRTSRARSTLEAALAAVAASGPDFASFAVTGGDPRRRWGSPWSTPAAGRPRRAAPGTDRVRDPRRRAASRWAPRRTRPSSASWPRRPAPPSGSTSHSAVDTVADVSITLPKGDGTFVRGDFRGVVVPGRHRRAPRPRPAPARRDRPREGGRVGHARRRGGRRPGTAARLRHAHRPRDPAGGEPVRLPARGPLRPGGRRRERRAEGELQGPEERGAGGEAPALGPARLRLARAARRGPTSRRPSASSAA